jgi:hypothetical protein
MDAMERRVFLKGASTGLFAFTVGGVETLMTPREARARAVPFRMLSGEEGETLAALGETLVPGAHGTPASPISLITRSRSRQSRRCSKRASST